VKFTLSVVASFFLITTASAHHSVAEFDESFVREIEGEVVAVQWRNPHVLVKIRTEDSNGAEEIWTLEGRPVVQLDNGGVSRDSITIGDRVRAGGWESARRDFLLGNPSVLLPSGVEVIIGTRATPYWSERFEAGAIHQQEISSEREAASRESAIGIFRVWARPPRSAPKRRPGPSHQVVWSAELPLTNEAAVALDAWNAEDDPVNRCVPPGMHRAMSLNPFPIEFVADGDDITLRLQEFDTRRVVHMNGSQADEQTPWTTLGYSVGHWEEDRTLVVETTHIDYPFFNRVGVRQSEDVRVTERFTLNDDDTELGYEIIVEDPVVLTAPVVGTKHWIWIPGLELQDYDCASLEPAQ
jgi:hypothetical protein